MYDLNVYYERPISIQDCTRCDGAEKLRFFGFDCNIGKSPFDHDAILVLTGLIAYPRLSRLGGDVTHQNISLMRVPRAIFLIFLQSTLSALVAASESPPVALGKSCSTTSNRLDPRTKRFTSDCDSQTFCSGTINGTCIQRQCRREDFPSGYDTNQTVPVLCPAGSFCPDEGDACRPLVPIGQPCQFNRDDQCVPSNTPELADYHNFYGSVCLHSICT